MSHTTLVRFSALAATAALFGAGCMFPLNSQQPVQPATPPAAAPATTPTETTKPTTKPKTTTVVPRTSTVTIVSKAFSPLVLAITTGDTVVWTNKDSSPHTTISDNALVWDSGNIAPGASYKRVFSSPGTYTYHCGVHPEMMGTIVVRDAVK